MNVLKFIVNRGWSTLLSLDQLGCAIIFGKPDHTISGETGYAAYLNKEWGLWLAPKIDAVFGKDHCKNSIEWDRATKPPVEIWR